MKTALYFSPLWPKQSWSAMFNRTIDIHNFLTKNNFSVNFVCPQKKPIDLGQLNHAECSNKQIDPNDFYSIKELLKDSKTEFAIFDTFLAEEMFSIHLKEYKEKILRVLDT